MKRHVKIRQARNRQIAAEDAKHRCSFCRKILPARAVVTLDGRKFCDDSCLESAEQRATLMTRTGK